MRCLLIGPYTESPGATGEDTFVRSLISNPPAGIEYVHYSQLLADNKASRQPWVHALFSRLDALGYLSPAPWLETFTCDEDFDLVHVHGFDVRLAGAVARKPVILSTSSYGPENCRSYWGWEEDRIARYHRRVRCLFRRLHIYDACNNTMNAARTIVWSEYARALHLAGGADPKYLSVIPPGVEVPHALADKPLDETRVLFVGQDFRRKGGDILLRAWSQIPAPRARLIVIGGESVALPAGARHFQYVSPAELKNDFYTKSHILALPSRAEGYGLAALEAMAHGLVVVASNTGALPEIVVHGETGCLVPVGGVGELARRLRELIYQPNLCRAMGAAGYRRAQERFGEDLRNRLLLDLYEETIGQCIPALEECAAA